MKKFWFPNLHCSSDHNSAKPCPRAWRPIYTWLTTHEESEYLIEFQNFLANVPSAECEVCNWFCRSLPFWLISGFVKFFKNDHYMNRPEKLLSADSCSHYKTTGWVTPRFSVHITRDISCQLPRKWSSIDSIVGDLPYYWLRVGFKGLRFSSVAKYRPIL